MGKAEEDDQSEEWRTEKKEQEKEAEEEEKEVSPPKIKSQIAREAKKENENKDKNVKTVQIASYSGQFIGPNFTKVHCKKIIKKNKI